jgi:hypothetical protein
MAAPMDSVNLESLRGWTPVHVASYEPRVDWAIVRRALSDAFFEVTASRAMDRPFNRVFARTTSLAPLDALGDANEHPADPVGLVFHMSRCGSTLVSQMLSRIAGVATVSEPQAVDGVLRAHRSAGAATTARRLRGVVRAMGAALEPPGRLVLKLNAWHVLVLTLFEEAWPRIPWAFVFREPRAVLRSQRDAPGAEIVPGTLDPADLGIDPAEVGSASYGPRVLAAFCDAALRHAGDRALFVDYDTLPGAVADRIAPFFGIRPSETDLCAMNAAARIDTKRAGSPFKARDERVDGTIDRDAIQWLDASYAALRRLAAR